MKTPPVPLWLAMLGLVLPPLLFVHLGVHREVASHWRAGEYVASVVVVGVSVALWAGAGSAIELGWTSVVELRRRLSPLIATTTSLYRFVEKTEVDLYVFLVLTIRAEIDADRMHDWLQWAAEGRAPRRAHWFQLPRATPPEQWGETEFDLVAADLRQIRATLAKARKHPLRIDVECVCTLLFQYLLQGEDTYGPGYPVILGLLSGDCPPSKEVSFLASLAAADYDAALLSRGILPGE